MNTIRSLSTILLIAIFISCSDKGTNEVNYSGKFIIDNTSYKLSHGLIEYAGPSGKGYLFGIVLGSEGIHFVDGSVEGIGDILYLHIFSSSESELSSLSYSLDETDSGLPGSYWGYSFTNRNFNTGSIGAHYFITSGTLNFSAQSHTSFEITGTCKQIENNTVKKDGISFKLVYSGNLEVNLQEKTIREI